MATLKQVCNAIKRVALKQPIVNGCYEGSVYTINSDPSTKYANVTITQQQHTETDKYMIYNFYIFYTDRLVDDLESNRLQVQSVGMQVLGNIFNTLEEEQDWTINLRQYNTYEQRFQDLCAGCYCNVRIETMRDGCVEYYSDNMED